VVRFAGQRAATTGILSAALCLALTGAAEAQPPDPAAVQAAGQGVLPDASFEIAFRKYTPPENVLSPFYSWDAHMTLRLTAFRRGRGALDVLGLIQTIGTENLGSRVSVGGTGYILGLGYVHRRTRELELSAGFLHLSSHLTRDLDQKDAEERRKGSIIPTVADPPEYNVLFVKAHRTFSSSPLTPEIEVALEPINFRFDGGRHGYVRPIYIGARATLLRSGGKSLVAETHHEIGRNSFSLFSVVLELFPRGQNEGRFQMFLNLSPGHSLRVSPNIGGVRDGIAVGIRAKFRA
jgi:hypothetical protein